MAWQLCWWCNENVPTDESTCLDDQGKSVTWEYGVVPSNPAHYHADCGILYSAQRNELLAAGALTHRPPAARLSDKPRKPSEPAQLSMFEESGPMTKKIELTDGESTLTVFLEVSKKIYKVFIQHGDQKGMKQEFLNFKRSEEAFEKQISEAVQMGWKLK